MENSQLSISDDFFLFNFFFLDSGSTQFNALDYAFVMTEGKNR